MKKKIFYLYCLIIFVLFLGVSCATQTAAMKQSDNSKEIAVLKKLKLYDLLEEELLKNNRKYKNSKNLLGQLFSALDLADFYLYGFINFSKSLHFYNEAFALNIETNNQISPDGYYYQNGKKSEIFITEGKFTYARRYDYLQINELILKKKKTIENMLSGNDSAETEDIDHNE